MQALPQDFIGSLAPLGDARQGLIEALEAGEASVSIRVNRLKYTGSIEGLERVPWCADGYYLSERRLFAADPMWHQGVYYVQEASSMAAGAAMAELVDSARGVDGRRLRVLDACAAPGGKTAGILSALDDEDFVVANEYDAHRCNILLENLSRWGRPNVAVSRGDARAYAKVGEVFDIIAADVPCSGEGMMRKEAVAVSQWSESLVASCAAMQREIVDSLWQALVPGGYMLYSTCTFNMHENEAIVRHLIDEYGAESVALELAKMPGVHGSLMEGVYACRFLPGCVRGEGLFVAALRKPFGCANDQKADRLKEPKGIKFSTNLLKNPERYIFTGTDTIEAVPAAHATFVERLGRAVRLVRRGLPVAHIKGSTAIPAHELAMSTVLNREALPAVELDLAAAYSYLRGNALTELPSGCSRGFLMATFAGRPLGLAKCVGSRANNLYPAEQRLRLGDDALAAETTPTILP